MTRFLLDTNIIARLVAAPEGPLAQRVRQLPAGAACVSILVAAEIRYGLMRRRSKSLAERTLLALEALPVLPFEAPADEYYGALRAELERAGAPIGGNEMLIAAHALALDCTLVTANARAFRRVPGLRVENWLVDEAI